MSPWMLATIPRFCSTRARERGVAEARTGAAVIRMSPRDGVVGEMADLPRDLLSEEVVQRRHERDDPQPIGRVGDLLRGQRPVGAAIRITQRQIGGYRE